LRSNHGPRTVEVTASAADTAPSPLKVAEQPAATDKAGVV
jgi:hypothetical protein